MLSWFLAWGWAPVLVLAVVLMELDNRRIERQRKGGG
jgi:hypothetical protein